MWSKIVQLKVCVAHPDILFYKYNCREEYRKCAFRITVPVTRDNQRKEYAEKMKQKYVGPRGITLEKKHDLLQLCKKSLIPRQHHSFYEGLEIRHTGVVADVDVPILLSEVVENQD